MPSLLIVYHSRTGGAAQMAQACFTGAQSEIAVHTRLLQAEQTVAADILAAQGLVFVCPENLASMSGAMKEFFDRCYYDVIDQIAGRPYATMICAGSDGQGTARQIARIAMGWRLKAIADPLIVHTHAQTPQAITAPKQLSELQLQACTAVGQTFATGLAMGIF